MYEYCQTRLKIQNINISIIYINVCVYYIKIKKK